MHHKSGHQACPVPRTVQFVDYVAIDPKIKMSGVEAKKWPV